MNLSLDVTRRAAGRLPHGPLVMLAVSLCDEVEILLDDSRAVTAESNLSFLPNDARNLAVRAVAVLFSPRRGQRTSARG